MFAGHAGRCGYTGPTIVLVATRYTAATRAKDGDRNDICQVLDGALADGQLSGFEHRERVAQATRATTLGELRALVADLQVTSSPVRLPDLRERRRLPSGTGVRIAMAVVLVLFGVAVGWGLYGNTPSPLNFTSDPGARSDGIPARVLTAPRQLHSLGGLTGLFEQMRQKFGDTTGYELTVYPDYASLDRPDPADDRRTLSYTYRGGWQNPTVEPRRGDGEAVDLSGIDPKQIIAVLRGAPETLGIAPADVTNTYLVIEPDDDPTAAPGSLRVTVNVSSDFGSGSIKVDGDGGDPLIRYPG